MVHLKSDNKMWQVVFLSSPTTFSSALLDGQEQQKRKASEMIEKYEYVNKLDISCKKIPYRLEKGG